MGDKPNQNEDMSSTIFEDIFIVCPKKGNPHAIKIGNMFCSTGNGHLPNFEPKKHRTIFSVLTVNSTQYMLVVSALRMVELIAGRFVDQWTNLRSALGIAVRTGPDLIITI